MEKKNIGVPRNKNNKFFSSYMSPLLVSIPVQSEYDAVGSIGKDSIQWVSVSQLTGQTTALTVLRSLYQGINWTLSTLNKPGPLSFCVSCITRPYQYKYIARHIPITSASFKDCHVTSLIYPNFILIDVFQFYWSSCLVISVHLNYCGYITR
jgi:hypothetical protein